MRVRRTIACCILLLSLAGCASSSDSNLTTFVIQHRADPGPAGQFVVRTSDRAVIAAARQQLTLTPENRKLHVNGTLARGDGGYNAPWHWRIEDNRWQLAEMSIELCDGRPSFVDEDLDYWVDTVKRYCPWSSYVLEER